MWLYASCKVMNPTSVNHRKARGLEDTKEALLFLCRCTRIETALDELNNETEALMWSFSWLKAVFPSLWIVGLLVCINAFWLYQRLALNGETSSEYKHFVLWSIQKSLRLQTSLDLAIFWICPCKIAEILMFKMLTTMNGSASALQAKLFFGDLMVVSSTPMLMSQKASTTVGLLKTYVQDFYIYLEITH